MSLFFKSNCVQSRFSDAYNNLGMAYQKKIKLIRQYHSYRAAIACNSNFSDALANLGAALAQRADKGDLDESIKVLELAIHSDSKNPAYFNNLGITFEKKGDWDEAIKNYKQASMIDPRNQGFLNNLALAYRKFGRLEQAIKSYQSLIEIEPNRIASYADLGATYIQTKEKQNYELAVRFQKGLELSNDDFNRNNNLGAALQRLGRPQEALAHYELAIKKNPNNVNITLNLANLFYSENNFKESFEWYDKARKLGARNCKIFMARSLQGQKKFEEAIDLVSNNTKKEESGPLFSVDKIYEKKVYQPKTNGLSRAI